MMVERNQEMIRKACKQDIGAVSAIYEAIHDSEEAGDVTIGWIRGVYPTKATAEAAVLRDDLYVLDEEDIRGAAIINQIQPDSYKEGAWTVHAEAMEVLVLHTLVIHPAYAGRGYGREMVAFYEEMARERHITCLRMDTNSRNQRARNLYASLGYHEVDIVPCEFNGIPDVRLVLLEKQLDD